MDLNSSAWCDLVFEGKNKKYGAYYLRKTSSTRHWYALFAVTGTICILMLSLSFLFHAGKTDKIILNSINLSELIAMTVYDAQLPPPEKEKPFEKEKTKQPPLKIVTDEEIVESPEQTDNTHKNRTTVADSSADSIAADDHMQQLPDYPSPDKEPVTYILDQTNQDKELQTLRTNILRYVYYNAKYPDVAYKQKIKGRVVYSFVVNTDGSISDIALVKGVYIFLDEEVLRVIQSMPAQEPVKESGKAVRAKIYLPVEFAL